MFDDWKELHWELHQGHCHICGAAVMRCEAEAPDSDYHFGCDQCGSQERYGWDHSTKNYKKIMIFHTQKSSLSPSDFPVSIETIQSVRDCFGEWGREDYCFYACDFAQECKANPNQAWQERHQREMEIERQFEEKSRGCDRYEILCPKCHEYEFSWRGKDGLAHYWCGWCGHEEAYDDGYDYFGETISRDEDKDDFDKAIGIKELWKRAKAQSKRKGRMIRGEE